MNDFLILDTDSLMQLCDDGTEALDALLASGQRIFVSETVLAELMAQAEAVLPRIASLWACNCVLETSGVLSTPVSLRSSLASPRPFSAPSKPTGAEVHPQHVAACVAPERPGCCRAARICILSPLSRETAQESRVARLAVSRASNGRCASARSNLLLLAASLVAASYL